jgi:hypothetical protein
MHFEAHSCFIFEAANPPAAPKKNPAAASGGVEEFARQHFPAAGRSLTTA